MVDDAFITPAQVPGLRQALTKGMNGLGNWKQWPEVTIVRQGGAVLGTMACINIRLDNQEPSNAGTGTPSTSTVQSGTVTAWAADLPVTDIKQGDRFIWNERSCVIEFGPVETLKDSGVVRMGFVMGGRVP